VWRSRLLQTAAGAMATASETFPTESHVPRSFVDYQLARSAQTRYALGSLHSDAALAAGTDLSRHFTRAPAQPTAWSSGQATVLPWREADTRLETAARNVQRIYRGQTRSYYEMAKQALRIQQRQAAEFAEMMRAVSREKKDAPRGSEEGAAVLAALLAAAEAPPVAAAAVAAVAAAVAAPVAAAPVAAAPVAAAPVAAAPVAAAATAPANAKLTASEAMAVRAATRAEPTRPAPAAPVAVAAPVPVAGLLSGAAAKPTELGLEVAVGVLSGAASKAAGAKAAAAELLSGAAAKVALVAAPGHAPAPAPARAPAPAPPTAAAVALAPAPAPAKHVPSMPQRRSTIEAQLQASPLGGTGGSTGASTGGGIGGGSLGSGLGGTADLPEEMRQVLSGVAPGRPIELPAGSGQSAEELQARCSEMQARYTGVAPWGSLGWLVL